ncbi:MAG: hypothetical protein MI919_05745 [Holophagales bacterium]|nr:hypothetical protein [Holophagales bacterium]
MAKKPASDLRPAAAPEPGGQIAQGRRARDNPFRVARQEALGFRLGRGSDVATWPALEARLERHGFRGAIVGPKGTGKTTLLHELEDRFEAWGWRVCRLRLSRHTPRPPAAERRRIARGLGPQTLLSVDGAEQLGRAAFWHLRFLARGAGALVITAHRPGLLPTLLETNSSPDLLVELVAELAPELVAELEPGLDALYERHAGNLRECLRELYDNWAEGRRHPITRATRRAPP